MVMFSQAKCSSCGSPMFKRENHKMKFVKDGKEIKVDGISCAICPNCGEIFLSETETRRVFHLLNKKQEEAADFEIPDFEAIRETSEKNYKLIHESNKNHIKQAFSNSIREAAERGEFEAKVQVAGIPLFVVEDVLDEFREAGFGFTRELSHSGQYLKAILFHWTKRSSEEKESPQEFGISCSETD